MNAVSAFFMQNIVYVYFFYGLAFFGLGLVVLLESTRSSEFRFARALRPLALFGFIHGGHEWFEMFQIFAAHQSGHTAGLEEELVRIGMLAVSFLCLWGFGVLLLPDAEQRPRAALWRVLALAGIWLGSVGVVQVRLRPTPEELLTAADVLARYTLGIPGALLATWALLRERRDFHARGMSAYGQDLLWAALAFFIYGVVGQLFTRPSLLFPTQVFNTVFFLRTFGIPVQLLRGLAAVAIAITLGRALRAFEQESRIRLARVHKERLEAQTAVLEAQQRRTSEVEALNVQLQATARELSAMVEMARILSSTMELDRLLNAVLPQVVGSFERACCSALFLRRPDGKLELAAEYRRPNAPEPVSFPPLTQAAADAFAAQTPVGAGLDGQVYLLTDAVFAAKPNYRLLAVPLHAKGQLFGGLVLSSLREEEPFGRNELGLLNAFGQQLAAAVEHAELYQILQQRETRLEELVRQLVNAQESERKRIAQELHDETGQELTAIALGLAAMETVLREEPQRAARMVHNLRELADQSLIGLRQVMANLRPPQLDDLGLVPALRWYVQQYAERHPELAVNFTADRLTRRLPSQYEIVLFRVAQEALTNVARHAHATQVTIGIHQEAGAIRLEIGDNGVGFDVDAQPQYRSGGLGLVGIRERVTLVGGQCTVESQKGHGTRIRVQLPLKREAE